MTRLNLILFFALMFSALGLVNAQHKARKLYIELEQLNEAARLYDQEYGQLQLEQSTWAMHSRIEHIAAQALQMQVPDPTRIQVVSPDSKGQPPALPQSGQVNHNVVSPAQSPTQQSMPKLKADASVNPMGAAL